MITDALMKMCFLVKLYRKFTLKGVRCINRVDALVGMFQTYLIYVY